jgi:tetratricopeptide (TPR) repeat protein
MSDLIDKIETLMKKGEYKIALDLIESNQITSQLQIKKAIIFEKIGKFTESLDLANQIYNTSDDSQTKIQALICIAYGQWRIYEYDNVLNTIDEILIIIKESDIERSILLVYEAEAFYIRGIIFNQMNKMEQSTNDFHRSLELRTEVGNKETKAHSLNALGINYDMEGYYDISLEYHYKGLKLKEELGNKQDIYRSLINIAGILKNMGEIDNALIYYKRGISLALEIGNIYDIIHFYDAIASIYIIKQEFGLAQENLDKVYQFANEKKDPYLFEKSYSSYINLYLNKADLEKAEIYFTKLQDIAKQLDKPNSKQVLKFNKGKIFKKKKSIKQVAQALAIFDEMIESRDTFHDFLVGAMLNKADLLFQEISMFKSTENIEEVLKLINKLQIEAEKQNSTKLKADLMFFEGKVLMLQVELNQAEELFIKGLKLCKDRKMENLAKVFEIELYKLKEHKNILGSHIKTLDIDNKLLLLEFDEMLDGIINNKLGYNVKETENPLIFFVQDAESGLIKYSKVLTNDLTIQENLISSFISAINIFSTELIKSPSVADEHLGAIHTIKHDNFTIIMENIPGLIFTYIYKGKSHYSLIRLANLIEKVQANSEIINDLQKPRQMLSKNYRILLDDIADKIFNWEKIKKIKAVH